MNESQILDTQTYIRIANLILQGQYDENNIMKLISAIFILIKIDENNREITINMIKARVNGRIARRLSNLHSIYDILYELIQILNSHRTNQSNLVANKAK